MTNYTHHQLFWDLHHLSFFCIDCKHRVLVGVFPIGYKTASSVYQARLSEITLKHELSDCMFMNVGADRNDWKHYKRIRQVEALRNNRPRKYNTASYRSKAKSRTKIGRFTGLQYSKK